MRKATLVFVLAVAAVAVAAGPLAAKIDRAQATTNAVIEEAYRLGEIDRAEMILMKAYSIWAPDKLPEHLKGGVIEKCGTPIIEEIDRALPTLPPDIAEEIRGFRDRPVCDEYIDTEHFRIWYDTSGVNMILNWPDTTYRDAIATAAENCWSEEVDVLGFRQPPDDSGDPDGGGGSSHYDIYVQNLSGVYGYTEGRYTVPGTPQNDATSIVVIENDYAGFGYPDPQDPMKVTVAHEFSHACQYAHDYTEETWYKECTSVWMEDHVYDDINDYRQYLNYWFSYPYRSMEWNDGTGLRIYGSCVWNFYLAENFGPEIVPEIWYGAEGSLGIFVVFDITLSGHGSNIEEEFLGFSVWNFFTGARDDGNHYEEGAAWPTVPMQRIYTGVDYPIEDGAPYTTHRPDHMGTNYIRFSNPDVGYDGLYIAYDGPWPGSLPNAAFVVYRTEAGDVGEDGEIELNLMGDGDTIVEDWDTMDYVVLIVANQTDNVDDMNYTYDVEQVDTGIDGESHIFALRPASPNPFAESTAIAYSVPTGGGHVEITVYDVSGRVVRTLTSAWMDAGDGVAVWDGRDDAGRPVATGVYFARLDIDGLTAMGKLMVLK